MYLLFSFTTFVVIRSVLSLCETTETETEISSETYFLTFKSRSIPGRWTFFRESLPGTFSLRQDDVFPVSLSHVEVSEFLRFLRGERREGISRRPGRYRSGLRCIPPLPLSGGSPSRCGVPSVPDSPLTVGLGYPFSTLWFQETGFKLTSMSTEYLKTPPHHLPYLYKSSSCLNLSSYFF